MIKNSGKDKKLSSFKEFEEIVKFHNKIRKKLREVENEKRRSDIKNWRQGRR